MSVALAISASARQLSLALRLADGRIVVPALAGSDRADDLTAATAAAFAAEGLSPSALSELRVDLGPGSYTGLRVAVTFARVVQAFHGVQVTTTTSLQLAALAAWRARTVDEAARIRPVLDARRQRFHHAGVQQGAADAGAAVLVDSPRATSLEELVEAIRPGETILAEATLHETLTAAMADVDREVILVNPSPWDASLLFDEGLRLSSAATEDLNPLYLMGSYAE